MLFELHEKRGVWAGSAAITVTGTLSLPAFAELTVRRLTVAPTATAIAASTAMTNHHRTGPGSEPRNGTGHA